MLSILAFSLLIIPTKAFAVDFVNNPIPYVTSISPDSINSPTGTNYTGIDYNNIVIAITGNGFIPSSIARVNGSDRLTTFIDASHILIKLNPNDIRNTDGFYINVFNRLPGGGYSNAEFFTVNNIAPATNTNNNYSATITKNTGTVNNNNNTYNRTIDNTYSNTVQTQNTTNLDENDVGNANQNFSALAATALYGSSSFLPSSLIQWVILAIIILIIIILVRRISGAKKNYDESPLKSA